MPWMHLSTAPFTVSERSIVATRYRPGSPRPIVPAVWYSYGRLASGGVLVHPRVDSTSHGRFPRTVQFRDGSSPAAVRFVRSVRRVARFASFRDMTGQRTTVRSITIPGERCEHLFTNVRTVYTERRTQVTDGRERSDGPLERPGCTRGRPRRSTFTRTTRPSERRVGGAVDRPCDDTDGESVTPRRAMGAEGVRAANAEGGHLPYQLACPFRTASGP